MREIPQISEAEYEVMKVVWKKKVVRSSEIIESLSQQTEWKPKTIQTLITRLVAKGVLISEKGEGKAYSYRPAIQESEYRKREGKSFLERIYNGSVKMMMMHFLKEQRLSEEDIQELKNLLEEKEEHEC